MDYKEFETCFLFELKKNNKKCISMINENKDLIETYLGENGNQKTVDAFIKRINQIILQSKKRNLIEIILRHKLFTKVYSAFKNSTILLEACQLGSKVNKEDLLKWLMTMDINPCVQDVNGYSALMLACKDPKLVFVVKQLLLHEDCLNLVDKNGENALFHSIHNPSALLELLKTNININQLNLNNDSVLLHCCKNGCYDVIKLLTIRKDIDVNIMDENGRTPAMYLVENGRSIELMSLNQRNCNFDIINQKNESALSLVINKIYSQEKETRPGYYKNYFTIIRSLAAFNCDFNTPIDDNGNTAIMILILVNDTLTLTYVLNHNKHYDLTLKNNFGESALSLCLKCTNFFYIFNIFKKNSTIDYNYLDQNFHNSLLMLCALHETHLFAEILSNSVNLINHLNDRNENALILATKFERISNVESLLKSGINVNQQDYLGNSALYYAVDLKNPQLVGLLMDYNADINLKNNEGKSILDYAKELNNADVLSVLTGLCSYDMISSRKKNQSKKSSQHEENKQCKYQDTLEYLYPWIENNYGDFKLTENMRRVQINYLNNSITNSWNKGMYYTFFPSIF